MKHCTLLAVLCVAVYSWGIWTNGSTIKNGARTLVKTAGTLSHIPYLGKMKKPHQTWPHCMSHPSILARVSVPFYILPSRPPEATYILPKLSLVIFLIIRIGALVYTAQGRVTAWEISLNQWA